MILLITTAALILAMAPSANSVTIGGHNATGNLFVTQDPSNPDQSDVRGSLSLKGEFRRPKPVVPNFGTLTLTGSGRPVFPPSPCRLLVSIVAFRIVWGDGTESSGTGWMVISEVGPTMFSRIQSGPFTGGAISLVSAGPIPPDPCKRAVIGQLVLFAPR
jgi:hypothetical protein